MSMSKLTITITDTPLEAAIIALSLRRYLLQNTQAFISDNCAVGSETEPRKITAEFSSRKDKLYATQG